MAAAAPVAHPSLRRNPWSAAAFAALALLTAVAMASVDRGAAQLRAGGLDSTAPGLPALSSPHEAKGMTGGGDLPLAFAPNRGQSDRRVLFQVQQGGFSVYFERRKARIVLPGEGGRSTLELGFVDSPGPKAVEARHPTGGIVNYLGGGNGERLTRIPTYDQIAYRELWPGIDLVFKGVGGQLEYELVVHPGARVDDIRFAYAGAQSLSLAADGRLLVHSRAGLLSDARPRSYQRVGGRKVPVESRFALHGRPRGAAAYGFAIGPHERDRTLVIDPGLSYSTYVLTQSSAEAYGIAVDSAGSAYVVGTAQHGSDSNNDAFMAKLSPDGSTLEYVTYMGGSVASDRLFDVAVDSGGHAYFAGDSQAQAFPTTPGAYDTTFNGFGDAVVGKLSPDGSTLEYSTYLGSRNGESGSGIAIDADGNAYVTGVTAGSNTGFPTTPGAFDTSHTSNNLFVTKLDPTGSSLVYSTFGPTADFLSSDIAIDSEGSAFVGGENLFEDVPTTPGAFDTTAGGVDDGFMMKLRPDGSALDYATYIGGTEDDRGHRVAIDADGSAFLVGDTNSPDFPTTPGAQSTTLNLGGGGSLTRDGFVSKLSPDGSQMEYSTFLGGMGYDGSGGTSMGIGVDGVGHAVATGLTSSADFPVTPDSYDPTFNGSSDSFVVRLGDSGRVIYGTYFAGVIPRALTVNRNGEAYLTGRADSELATTSGAYDTVGPAGAFVTKFDLPSGPPARLSLEPDTATNTVDSEHCVTASVTDGNDNPLADVTVRFSVSGATALSDASVTDAGGQATLCYSSSLPGADGIDAFADTNGDGTQGLEEPGDSALKTWLVPDSTPGCKVTGGGRIRAANGDIAVVGGRASVSAAGDPSGEPRYTDRGPADRFTLIATSVDALVCEGGRATIFGGATIDGDPVDYRIEVIDRGQPGSRDSYRLLLSDGYDSGLQRVAGGNLRVRE